MKSFLKKYHISLACFVILSLTILLTVYILNIINIFLSDFKIRLEDSLGKHFNQKVTIKRIRYLPLNSILLEKFSLYKDRANQQISIKNIKLKFSLKSFIGKKDFIISKIYLTDLKAFFWECPFFIKETIEQIIDLINSLPEYRTLNITLQDASVVFPFKKGLFLHLTTNSILKITQDKLISSLGDFGLGYFSMQKKDDFLKGGSRYREKFLRFKFYSKFKGRNIIIENLEMRKRNFHLKLWGRLQEGVLKLSGFSFLNGFFKEIPLYKEKPTMMDRLVKILKFKRNIPFHFITGSAYDLNILDIDCLAKFTSHQVDIKKLRFTINGTPLQMSCNFLFLNPATVDLKLSSYPNQSLSARLQNPRMFDIFINGDFNNGKFSGRLEVGFLKKTKTKKILHKMEVFLENFNFDFIKKQRLRVYFDKANFLYSMNENIYELFFENFNSLINLEDKRFKFIKFDSLIFDGFLEGKGVFDTNWFPFRTDFKINVNNLSANRIHSLSYYFCRAYGLLNSSIHYRSYPHSEITGNLTIRDGYLDNLRFFIWIADNFDLEYLKKAGFDRLSADFLLNDEVMSLENVDLFSKDVKLKGYFRLSENDLVSSKLSLNLSKKLLKTSSKFDSLLRLLGEDIPSISFNFQLSGLFDAMNFKWLESDFKIKLQELLSPSIKKIIEKRIQKAMEAIAVE